MKDRAAYSMIREGERTGDLRPGKVILDATSGNTGIAYAMIGAALGYRVKLCLPASASPERKQILASLRRRISFTRRAMKARTARSGAFSEIYESDREKYFYPDQYSNPANPGGTLRHHRPGNLAADTGQHHAFCRRPGHQRHISSAPRGA